MVLPYDHGRGGRGRTLWFLVTFADSLPLLAGAVVILLLAGPQELDAPKTRRKLTNIEFCLDVSGSMTAGFGEGTRYDAAMAAINDFIDARPGDAFGLTFFGGAVLHWVPLTSDTSAFRCAPPFMDPKRGTRPGWFGSTAIGKALYSCRKVLMQRETGDRMIILVSDGYSGDLGGGADELLIRGLREEEIVVYAIHIAEGELPGEIANIVGRTGGMAFQPGEPGALNQVFQQIDEMEAAELEKLAAEQVDDFELLSIIGMSLVGAYLLARFGLRYTPW
jgi:Ca-activated chloride channel family protein